MHLSSMVEMIESGFADRELLGAAERRVTGAELGVLAKRGAATLPAYPALVYAGENHPLLPVALLAAACAGVPFVPVNYRLDDTQLNSLIDRQPTALVLADAATAPRVQAAGRVAVFDDWLAELPADPPPVDPPVADDDVAVVLYTSGTTAAPKSALLRHRHLMAYLLSTVEFGSAGAEEAVLVSVPPYHVAGVANMLSNLFAGRRLVYLRAFDPSVWLDTVRAEAVTNAMVVPTMLARIVDAVAGLDGASLPTLRSLSYGGAKVSERILREALTRLPDVGFVNAYGLTETASTIAVLGPEDHRAALISDDPLVRARLSAAGQVLPTIEIEIRDDNGQVLPAGSSGIIFLRGEQISGEYATGSLLDADGWFCTRDRGHVDADGYLYIEGRADDTIIRGGENIAPAEIEEVLLSHPAVAQACVVGPPDDEWGQTLAAAVVLRAGAVATGEELRTLVRSRLRGSKTPEMIVFRKSLPHTDTGKLLRRLVLEDLSAH
ncbi:fatty acid--CoA ligase family protein [Nocardia sp. NPDC052112]|uniref:class I adenylate-forming enzyme family protein n=1 Tax=Nocardia sp. NPDC052112 TaxID=3155646 RepID=UPI0034443803